MRSRAWRRFQIEKAKRRAWAVWHTWRIEATHPGNKPAWVPDLAWIGHMAETHNSLEARDYLRQADPEWYIRRDERD